MVGGNVLGTEAVFLLGRHFFLGLRSFFAACLVFSCFRAHLLVGLCVCVCVCVVFLCIVLRFEIFDGCTNRIFSQHTAVKFDRWQF